MKSEVTIIVYFEPIVSGYVNSNFSECLTTRKSAKETDISYYVIKS